MTYAIKDLRLKTKYLYKTYTIKQKLKIKNIFANVVYNVLVVKKF